MCEFAFIICFYRRESAFSLYVYQIRGICKEGKHTLFVFSSEFVHICLHVEWPYHFSKDILYEAHLPSPCSPRISHSVLDMVKCAYISFQQN